ncbi:MAG: S8 family peptidase [candidate division FCPU426 bacterium]
MAGEQYRHIFLNAPTKAIEFTNPRKGSSDFRIPQRVRVNHSIFLRDSFLKAWKETEQRYTQIHVEREGVYLGFAGEPGFDLAFQSLERVSSDIRLLNVRRIASGETERIQATVYIPINKRSYFLNKIKAYAEELNRRSNKPKNKKLIESVSEIHRVVLESFWCDELEKIPGETPGWIEVWLNEAKGDSTRRFVELANRLGINIAEGFLKFPERAVVLICANRSQLERIIESSDDIAEFRLAKAVATYLLELDNQQQLQVARNLLNRCLFNNTSGVAICILDTGVNNGHILLAPILHNGDLHTVRAEWGINDDQPNRAHGTLMAGTAVYGDLLTLLNNDDPIDIQHCLESVKILPPHPAQNPRELWGYLTAQGISLAEIHSPKRKRIICMAITSSDSIDRGRPSSWSAEIDALSSGYSDDIHRLLIVSGGNVIGAEYWRRYPEANLTSEIQDPGQSWNALTIGAYTTKINIVDQSLKAFSAIAPSGGLSPYSTTSSVWPENKWPLKPDVLFEGGNVAKGPNDSIINSDDLGLLSTHSDPQIAQFSVFGQTSAATAQASWMAAKIYARYPESWPETIRALIVHTAEWTDEMKSRFMNVTNPTKRDYVRLIRICGYGVPNLERALYCASNSLTLIAQAELQPFNKKKNVYITNAMHLYRLPWPKEVLAELGETPIEMRVTLSYFIEPGPGEIGWDNRYRYASHAFRFEMNGPGESEKQFVERINSQARQDGLSPGTVGPRDRWLIGEARNVGSIHSDKWKGRAIDLSNSNKIAVYPAVGWWRERNSLHRWNRKSRYSLIISINTPRQDIDIYTPVAIQVGLAIPIPISS